MLRPALWRRIACDRAGVGVNRSRLSTRTVTPFAAKTSSAVTHAGSDRACVSLPRNSGPAIPCAARCSQMAWLVAAMWSSLKAHRSDDPRCPEVPNATRCDGTDGSGCSE